MAESIESQYGPQLPPPAETGEYNVGLQPHRDATHRALLAGELAAAATADTVTVSDIDYDAEAYSLVRTMAPELISPEYAEAQRLQVLQKLPHQGFESAEHVYTEMVRQIAAIGFPVGNIRRFTRRDNSRNGDQNVYASWGIGAGNYGEYSVHHLLESATAPERLGTDGHESAHANTPFMEHNAAVHGGEEKRLEAAKFINAAAKQAEITGVTLNGYHKGLLQDFKDGRISFATFAEETWAIMAEMALTNRRGLEIKQEAQLKALENHNRIMRRGGDTEVAPVRIVSTRDRNGNMQATGIDNLLVTTLEGVNNLDDLILHVGTLKQRFYGAQASRIATQRFTMQNLPELTRIATERDTISIHEGVVVFWALQNLILQRMADANKDEDDEDTPAFAAV